MTKEKEKPVLLLVDGHSLAFRSFYAFSKSGDGGLTTKKGWPTSVTYGFLKSLLDNSKVLSPEGLTIAFDTKEPTFRHKADPTYKANRDAPPEDFIPDLNKLQEILVNSLNIPICIKPSFEADDLLGTLAIKAIKKGWKVRILSGDRDLFQLVDDDLDIAIMYMGGGPYAKSGSPTLINEAGVKEKLGIVPAKVIDFKALTGDSSDNIPGIKGVGPKTAINLLNENINLDGIYNSLEKLDPKNIKSIKGNIKGALKKKLINGKYNAYLSRFLARIKTDVPIEVEPDFALKKVNQENLLHSLEELELHSLIRQLPSFVASFSKGGFKNSQNNIKVTQTSTKNGNQETQDRRVSSTKNNIPNIAPQIITTDSALEELVNKLMKCNQANKEVAIDTETTSLNTFQAELVGIGFCWGDNLSDLAYIPLGHTTQNLLLDRQVKQLLLTTVINALTPWLSSSKHPKVLQNAKYDRLVFLNHGIPLEGVVMDTLLGDYIQDAEQKHSLEEMAKREFGFKPTSYQEIVEKGQSFKDVDIKTASLYCGMDVYLTRKLSFLIKERLKKMGNELIDLLEKVEQPLEPILAEMEAKGIRIDIPYLKMLSKEFNKTLAELESKIYDYSGIKFNLKSPKQLGEVFFDSLALDKKKSRKTKTGWSTDSNVLEKLEKDHPIVSLVLDHRKHSKLLNTYVDALPRLVEEGTGRVHTDFNQAVTATGRLSSSNPNLQNIPQRTEFSRRIRKAFLPQQNWKLLSADYSQIELRILAHMSNEEVLQEAYRNGDDVHALTAKLLLEKKSITNDERKIGKTINFGVIYGMGAQKFARSTGVSQAEAKDFLNRYKDRYQNVFAFLELQKRYALSKGYVKTLLGRRRYFHFDRNGLGRLKGKKPSDIDLNLASKAGMEAQQLRGAANAPIQGSCADIVKVAMIQLNQKLKEGKFSANLLLQVHDELVLEVDPLQLSQVKELVINTMENAVKLNVPLVVETTTGDNWMTTK